MGGGKSENESEQVGSFKQNVWSEQVPFLQSLFQQAGNLFGTTIGDMQGLQGDVSNQLGNIYGQMNPAWQQQLQGGAYAGVDPNRVLRNLEQSMDRPSQTGQLYENIMGGQGNVFLGGMEDILARQSADRQAQGLRSLDQRAAAAGVGGGSPYRNLQRDIISDEADRLADVQTNLGFGTFDKDLGMKLDIARMADQNTLERQRMMQDMLGGQQAAMTGGLGFGQNMAGQAMGRYSPLMMPWQAMGQYANILGRPLVLGRGTSIGSSSGSGFGFGF